VLDRHIIVANNLQKFEGAGMPGTVASSNRPPGRDIPAA